MAKVPAYFTAAFDFEGNLKIQQIEYREVITLDGELMEIKRYPAELLHVANPTPQDVVMTNLLKDALGAVGGALADTCRQAEVKAASLEADIQAKDANIQELMAQVAEVTPQIEKAKAEVEATREEAIALRYEVLTHRAKAEGLEPPPPLEEWRAAMEGAPEGK